MIKPFYKGSGSIMYNNIELRVCYILDEQMQYTAKTHLNVRDEFHSGQNLVVSRLFDVHHLSEKGFVYDTSIGKRHAFIQHVVAKQLQKVRCIGEHPDLAETEMASPL